MLTPRRLLHIAKTMTRDVLAAAAPALARHIEFRSLDRITTNGHGRHEPELLLIPKLVPRDRIAVDVGANSGHYMRALERTGVRELYAFEPVPHLYRRLRALFPAAHLLPFAASSERGSRTLRIPHIGGVPCEARGSLSNVTERDETGFDELTIDTVRLDDVVPHGVGFIKIDVEGHEAEVLAGAMETIRRDRPLLLIEIEHRHHPEKSVADVARPLIALGYAVKFLEHRTQELRPLDEFALDVHQRLDDLGTDRYHNNFFFFPPQSSAS